MTATVVFGYAEMGLERWRREKRLLRDRDRAMHIAVTDDRPRAQLLGDQIEIAFDIFPLQWRGGGHHGSETGKRALRSAAHGVR
jgi:hypothetical protein